LKLLILLKLLFIKNVMLPKLKQEKIKELLTRGVEEIILNDHLEKKLKSGKKLRIKLGIDPTSPNLHLGRSVTLLKLRDFQELGHKIVLIIGDFTGVVGDTSDKDSERPMLEQKIIKQNMKNYVSQAGKLIDINKCEVRYNSEWLGKLDYAEIGAQADLFSVAEFITRENIKRRLNLGKRVSLREMIYPLMQGYDSVAIRADVEIGGTDQRFNLLAGRKMQPFYKQAPQNIITGPLVEGTDGRKMSSSWGNTINLNEKPNEMFGKVMSIRDELIIRYFTLVTRVPMKEVKKYEKEIRAGGNPRDYKLKLAYELVRFYHSEKAAKKAQEYFINIFSKKNIPSKSVTIKANVLVLHVALLKAKIITSKNELTRLVKQGGVKINNKKISDPNIKVKRGDLIQKGKRHFVKIV
jgi:tyrosyl-tRNA synthetase